MAINIDFDELLLDPMLFMMEKGQAPFTGGPTYANAHLPNRQTGVIKTAILRQNEIEKGVFDLSLMSPAHFEYLQEFINGGWGSGIGARVRWPHHNYVEREVIAGPGSALQVPNGVLTTFKLYRSWSRPGSARANVKRITKPVVQASKATGATLYEPNGTDARKFVGDSGAPVYAAEIFRVYHVVSGVETEIATGWTVNVTNGSLVYTSNIPATGTTVKVSMSYDLPCAFTDNEFNLSGDATGQARSVGLREIIHTELLIAF